MVIVPLLISKNMLSTERIIIRPSTVGGVGGKVNVYEPLFAIFSNNTKSKLSPPFKDSTKSTAWQFTLSGLFVFATSQVTVCCEPTSHTVGSDCEVTL